MLPQLNAIAVTSCQFQGVCEWSYLLPFLANYLSAHSSSLVKGSSAVSITLLSALVKLVLHQIPRDEHFAQRSSIRSTGIMPTNKVQRGSLCRVIIGSISCGLTAIESRVSSVATPVDSWFECFADDRRLSSDADFVNPLSVRPRPNVRRT